MILTRSERRALLFITGVLLASVLVKWLVPYETNTAVYDYSMEDSLFKAISADTIQREHNKAHAKKPLKNVNMIRSKNKIVLKEKSIEINSANQKVLEKLPGSL